MLGGGGELMTEKRALGGELPDHSELPAPAPLQLSRAKQLYLSYLNV